jgi:2-iminoacetate synthase ThiH
MSEFTLSPEELSRLLDEAAEKGARRALESVGLHDEAAGNDIRDLRTLVDGWRSAKRTALEALVKWVTVGILGLLAADFWLRR